MDTNLTKETAAAVCKVLDALSALAIDLSCHCDVPPHALILSAQRTREACAAIEESVDGLKAILRLTQASGGGPVPPVVARKLEDKGT